MKFGEAIDSALIKNYFNFSGKASRREYWWFVLFVLLSSIIVSISEAVAVGISQGSNFDPDKFYPYFFMVYMALIFLPSLTVHVRRFHDVGRTTKEAIVIYFVTQISSSMITFPNAYIRQEDFLSQILWFAFIASGFYTLYITLKESEEIAQ